MTVDEWRAAQEANGLTCSDSPHTNPDVPSGVSLSCAGSIQGGDLRIRTVYSRGAWVFVHATFLPSDAEGSVDRDAQIEALSIFTDYRYPGADPQQAQSQLTGQLDDPECAGTDCVTTIGDGIFHFQTGMRGAWVVQVDSLADGS